MLSVLFFFFFKPSFFFLNLDFALLLNLLNGIVSTKTSQMSNLLKNVVGNRSFEAVFVLVAEGRVQGLELLPRQRLEGLVHVPVLVPTGAEWVLQRVVGRLGGIVAGSNSDGGVGSSLVELGLLVVGGRPVDQSGVHGVIRDVVKMMGVIGTV